MNVAIASVNTHDKKSIYIKYERGHILHMLTEKIYITNFVTRSLQIDSEEKGRLVPGEQLSPLVFSWIKLAQVLNIPRIWDILALGLL
jgi:hypothetical protein